MEDKDLTRILEDMVARILAEKSCVNYMLLLMIYGIMKTIR